MAFDVAVVGAGPAGSTAALLLARHGLNVALLEKAKLPRYKTCGGGLVPRGLELLPADIECIVERRYERAELYLRDAALAFSAVRASPIVAMTMRDRLDFVLASCAARAGADLRARCRVRGVGIENRHVRLETDHGPLTAAFVIAADGATSDVARHAGWQDGRHLIPALEYEVQVDDRTLERFAPVPRFDVGIVPSGYLWVFPKAAHLSVGVLSVRRGPMNLHRYLDEYLRLLQVAPQSIERHGFVIPVRPRDGALARNRVLLVGDAAGLADPLTAEGISLAARSGRLAGEALLAGALDPARVQAAYHGALRPLLGELRVARALAQLLYHHPRARHWIFRRLGQRLVDAMTDVCLGARTYRGSIIGLLAGLRPQLGRRS